MNDTRTDIKSVHYRLLVAWFAGTLPLYISVMSRALTGHYGGQAEEAVAWMLSATMPTLLLILGVVAAESVQSRRLASEGDKTPVDTIDPPSASAGGATVDHRFFRFVLALSIFYLVLVNLIPWIDLVRTGSTTEFLASTNLFISPIQGLNSAALGVLFVSRERG